MYIDKLALATTGARQALSWRSGGIGWWMWRRRRKEDELEVAEVEENEYMMIINVLI
jgi:hypothetical protein